MELASVLSLPLPLWKRVRVSSVTPEASSPEMAKVNGSSASVSWSEKMISGTAVRPFSQVTDCSVRAPFCSVV